MKIGDKVRFLNAVGGGVISGFQGRDLVVVTDDDGFDIPTLITDVVVVGDTTEMNFPVREKNIAAYDLPKTEKIKNAEREAEPADLPVTFRAPVVERSGGDLINAYLAFVPVDAKNLASTSFELYFINDTNYNLLFTIANVSSGNRTLRHTTTAEANTKIFVDEIERTDLPDLERLGVQILVYKEKKAYLPKPAFDVDVRIDATKFYKLHTFRTNDFFREASLLIDIVRDDRPVRTVFADAAGIKEALTSHLDDVAAHKNKTSARPNNSNTSIVEIDLHAAELLDSTAGMSAGDILEYQVEVFRRTMQEHASHKGRKIVFIHGKGEGVLRKAIIDELRKLYPCSRHQDASFQEYGFGATMVIVG